MLNKRKIKVFKVVDGRIEYSDLIKEAVLNPQIRFTSIHLNGGYDWIDAKYGFIKLLLSRGQIELIETHNDILCRKDYLEAIKYGVHKAKSIAINFTNGKGKGAFASEKRILAARFAWQKFCLVEAS
jgi:hypothetical protein